LWSAQAETPVGAIVPAVNLWLLAHHWYDGRLALEWKPRPQEASQQLLTDAGFEGKFWSLAG
jgi:hypothetical protein